MYYSRIRKTDIADGTGVRVTLFVSGCRRHCPGCFNPETWSFTNGQPFTPETEQALLAAFQNIATSLLSRAGVRCSRFSGFCLTDAGRAP